MQDGKRGGYGMNEQEINKYIDELLEMDKEALIKRIVKSEYKAEQPAETIDSFDQVKPHANTRNKLNEKEWEAMDEFKRVSLKFKNIQAYRNANNGNFSDSERN